MAGERLQRARRGEAAQVLPVRASTRCDANAYGLRLRRCAAPSASDSPPTMRSPRRSAPVLERAVPVARVHVRRPHFDAVAARVLHQLRRRVEAHRLAVEQRGAERRRVVALEPGRDVDQQREARRVRFREAVLAEAEDLLEDRVGELGAGSRCSRMPRFSCCSNGSSPPLRFHAAIARRSWSASPGVKPAATIASCITCSWKIGTPSVRSSTLCTASLG